jgi:hypothetical protein
MRAAASSISAGLPAVQPLLLARQYYSVVSAGPSNENKAEDQKCSAPTKKVSEVPVLAVIKKQKKGKRSWLVNFFSPTLRTIIRVPSSRNGRLCPRIKGSFYGVECHEIVTPFDTLRSLQPHSCRKLLQGNRIHY